jgi:CBS domain-containing protein
MSEFDLPVARFMTSPVRTLRDSTPLTRAAQALEELGVSALPVVDHNGHLLGVLERADLLRAGRLRQGTASGEASWWWPDVPVEECMQPHVPVMAPTQTLRLCARRMLERGLHRVYVVGDHELEGVVSTREMMTAVVRAEVETPLADLGIPPAATSSVSAPLSVTRIRFLADDARAPLVIQNPSGVPLGVFTHAELQACLEAEGGQRTGLFMDRRILTLPASASLERAAREALASGAHHVIAMDGPGVYHVLSGATFTRSVAGGSSPSAEQSFVASAPAPPVIVRDPSFRTGAVGGILEGLPSWTGLDAPQPVRSEKPNPEPRREDPTRKREPA